MTRRAGIALLIAGVWIGLAACVNPLRVEYVNRRAFDPPRSLYLEWWEELEACVGRDGDFDGIRWFLADEIGYEGVPLDDRQPGGAIKGQWVSNRQIVIRTGYETTRWVVTHEMLHDLLRGGEHHAEPAWATCIPTE